MTIETKTKHVALHYSNRKQAKTFFLKILDLQFSKTFNLSKELSNEIFNIKKEVTVDVYRNQDSYFEVFITNIKKNPGYEHTCIEINDKEKFIRRCKEYEIKPIYVKKGDKTLLFIRDYSGNLFEIKEKQ